MNFSDILQKFKKNKAAKGQSADTKPNQRVASIGSLEIDFAGSRFFYPNG